MFRVKLYYLIINNIWYTWYHHFNLFETCDVNTIMYLFSEYFYNVETQHLIFYHSSFPTSNFITIKVKALLSFFLFGYMLSKRYMDLAEFITPQLMSRLSSNFQDVFSYISTFYFLWRFKLMLLPFYFCSKYKCWIRHRLVLVLHFLMI